MKRKIQKQFEFDGLGFPLILLDVPMRTVRGIDVPDIDYNILQKNVLHALALQPWPFTGNQIRFIRQYSETTYSDFATLFGVTHPTVIHWENYKDEYAKLSATTDICIRLYILDMLKASNKIFREAYRDLSRDKVRRPRGKILAKNELTLNSTEWGRTE